MLSWPERAHGAITTLFTPLQDIDVYVEDEGDEVFYTHLLKRVCGDKIRIARVFTKRGRGDVVGAESTHDHQNQRALFIIDGDLSWVLGDLPPNESPFLYQLDAYCIENMIFGESQIARILMEELVLTEEDAVSKIDFSNWKKEFECHLVKLFAAFAVCRRYCPSFKTVSHGVGKLCIQTRCGKTHLDITKVDAARKEALAAAKVASNEQVVSEEYNKILARINSLSNPLDAVSGKDFLIPLLNFRMNEHGCRIRTKSLRLKLALHCEIERFSALVEAMIYVANGGESSSPHRLSLDK